MNIIRVLVPKARMFPLDYSSDKDHRVGELVSVPFRNKIITGIVTEINIEKNNSFKLKTICEEQNCSEYVPGSLIELIKKASNYYLTEQGSFAKLCLPVEIAEKPIKQFEHEYIKKQELAGLSKEQQDALCLLEKDNKPSLIKGVTGSGKTEIYFHAVANQLKESRQALIMLPEISLSTQIIKRFEDRFGFKPAIWNSNVTKAQKKRILRGVILGSVKVLIGARSALFLPYKNLGIIVVDEEHDSSYKQSDGILYNARDMAILRGKIESSKVLLISATPSIESIYNAKIGKYAMHVIESRFNNSQMPFVEYINMKDESLKTGCWLSIQAINAIKATIAQDKQVLIFLNRRGYAPLLMCKNCGYRAECKSCSSSMVMHKAKMRLECHHCGDFSRIHQACPDCNKDDDLILCGPGIERIEEEVRNIFTNAKISTVSKEISNDSKKMQILLQEMQDNHIDILVGTQIITKGYHFPKLSLVIVVDADACFTGGDLRASERTFQLLHQVGGRAGREQDKGRVLLQTYMPEHRVIQALVSNLEEEFIASELTARSEAQMPPYTKSAIITITGKNPENTKDIARQVISYAPKSDKLKLLGPAEAIMYKISGKYRYKILIIAPRNFNLQKYIQVWQDSLKLPSYIHLKIDIDPYSFV